MLPGMLREREADPAAVLAAVGLPGYALDDVDAHIPFPAIGRLFEASVRIANVPCIGLLVGQRMRTG